MNKFESIYRILLAFMLVDNQIDENEKKVILEFLNTKFWNEIPKERQSISVQKQLMSFENFIKDAELAYNNFYTEDLYEVLDFVSKMIKSDWDIDSKEVKLFEVLISKWRISKDIMWLLWINKSLWSKFFK